MVSLMSRFLFLLAPSGAIAPARSNEVPGSVPDGSYRNRFEMKNLKLARGCELTQDGGGVQVS